MRALIEGRELRINYGRGAYTLLRVKATPTFNMETGEMNVAMDVVEVIKTKLPRPRAQRLRPRNYRKRR